MGFTYPWSNSFLSSYIRDLTDDIWNNVQAVTLSTTTPTISGTNVTPPVSGYSPATVTTKFGTAASNRQIANDAVISFVVASADWGTVTHAVLYDNTTQYCLIGALTSSETVFDTDQVSFPIGDLSFGFGGGISTYLANIVLSQVVGGVEQTSPTSFWIGLSTTAPNPDGTNVSEPAGGSYGRVGLNSDSTSWDAASNGSTGNTIDATFTTATASWGTLTHWVIYDQSSGGNLLFYAALDASQAVTTDDQVKFLPGDLTITIT